MKSDSIYFNFNIEFNRYNDYFKYLIIVVLFNT